MHVEAEVVRGSVHKVLFVGGPGGVLIGHVVARNESEPDQLFGHQLADLHVVVGQAHAGFEQVHRGLFDAEHRFVYLALAGREASVGGKTARHVAGVVAVHGSDVKQHHVAVVNLGVVGDVVQHTGVGARPDDRRVSKAVRAAAHKLVKEFCLELVLPHAGLEEAKHAVVAGGRDVGSHLHDFDFFGVFDGPQRVHGRRRTLVLVVRKAAAQVGPEAVFARLDWVIAANVLVAQQVDVVGVRHDVAQDALKIAEPVNALDSGQGAGLVLRQLGAFPAGDEVVGFDQKQHLALLGLGRVGKEYQNGFLLVHTAQP